MILLLKEMHMKIHLFITLIILHTQVINPCSIVAYIGRELCKWPVLQRLARLEYRGYDSAGFACFDLVTKEIVVLKKPGKIEALKELALKSPCDGYAAIGHTRWATHGQANELNAHPHTNGDHTFALAHNGIIENHFQIKQQLLQKGYTFKTETDTEVMVHLLDDGIKETGDLKEAALKAVNQLKGACTFVGLHKDFPDTLVMAR